MTVDEVRSLIETGLSDTAIQLLMDGADELIVERRGAHGTAVVYSDNLRFTESYIRLPRPAESIQSMELNEVALDADDYSIEHGGHAIRLWTYIGTGFGYDISSGAREYSYSQRTRFSTFSVNYTAKDDTNKRKIAMIELVRLEVQDMGLMSERVGDYSATRLDKGKERARILGDLGRTWRVS